MLSLFPEIKMFHVEIMFQKSSVLIKLIQLYSQHVQKVEKTKKLSQCDVTDRIHSMKEIREALPLLTCVLKRSLHSQVSVELRRR